jgi:Concanavalin A-like lectin/glucanases superfamily
MPCIAPPRGITDVQFPWSDGIDNNPCGKDEYTAGLCKLHWQMKNGLVGAGTPGIDQYTVFLLHADGVDGSTTFTDVMGHPLTAIGTSKIKTDQSKFGGSSAFFDGSAGGKVYTPDSPDWNLGSGDFTLDWWARFATVKIPGYFLGQYDASGSQRGWGVYMNAATTIQVRLSATATDGTSFTFPWSPTTGVWYHIAVVRTGNNLMVFVDGQQIGTTAALGALTIYDSPSFFAVGSIVDNTVEFNGWLDEVRVSKGIARWTSNFAVPTTPYT